MVSVADTGAIGDGVADDLPAIQKAIDSVAAFGGGIVTFPPGVFLVSGTIHVPDQVTLVGSGKYATTIKLTANANVPVIVSLNFYELSGYWRHFSQDPSMSRDLTNSAMNSPEMVKEVSVFTPQ